MEPIIKANAAEATLNKIQNPNINFLRPSQMVEHQEDIRDSEQALQNRDIQNKGAVMGRLHNLKRQYENQAPQPITDGRVKDVLDKREKELREQITQGMLSKEEMRKNPVGAVDHHRRWERANKAKILEWKKIRLAQQADNSHPDSWDRDVANLERYRPDGPQDRLRTDAQITGKMSYTHIPQERWDTAFEGKGPENTAIKQAIKRSFTEEQKEAARERLKIARAIKAAKAQSSHTTDSDTLTIVEGETVPHSEA